MDDPNRVALRRRNVLAVQPILRALRTSSLANWIAALAKQENAREYREGLARLWMALPPDARLAAERGHGAGPSEEPGGAKRVVLVVVGTERGLVGRFNLALAEQCEKELAVRAAQGCTVELVALGTRMIRLLRARGRPPQTALRFSTTLPVPEMAGRLTGDWLAGYERHALDEVSVLYAEPKRGSQSAPAVARLIPPSPPPTQAESDLWPPFEVETERASLQARLVEQWTAVALYDLLLRSAVAENAARSQLMDAATQNAQRVLDELLQTMQLAQQHAITSEMQELAAGAGLLGPRQEARAHREGRQTER